MALDAGSGRRPPHHFSAPIDVSGAGRFTVELIGATTTKAGLKVECVLDPRTHEKGIKVRDAEMAVLDIIGDPFHPEWNYTIKPRRQRRE